MPTVGDHLKVVRVGYSHHGIYEGDGKVIHYSGEPGSKQSAAVMQSPLEEFANGGTVEVVLYAESFPPNEVVTRARSRLGEARYHLLTNNCEHFARWCKTGDHASEQVHSATSSAGGATAGGAAVAAGMGVVTAGGAAAGVSGGAGIMTGLATAGSVVGSGAVAGIVVLAAAPVAVTTVAMQRVLKDDEKLPSAERDARKAGRYATVAGGTLGMGGSVVAVSVAGTAGLSSVGITTGLATIGAGLGGGMVVGTAVVIAAPAAAAAALGYGVYRVWRRLRSSTPPSPQLTAGSP